MTHPLGRHAAPRHATMHPYIQLGESSANSKRFYVVSACRPCRHPHGVPGQASTGRTIDESQVVVRVTVRVTLTVTVTEMI